MKNEPHFQALIFKYAIDIFKHYRVQVECTNKDRRRMGSQGSEENK